MKSVEEQLNSKALKLGDFTNEVEKTDQRQSEEYLLGLLMQHQGKWSADQQTTVMKKFAKTLPIAQEVLDHHDTSKSFAMELGELMDKKKNERNAAKKASQVFLQLSASLPTLYG